MDCQDEAEILEELADIFQVSLACFKNPFVTAGVPISVFSEMKEYRMRNRINCFCKFQALCEWQVPIYIPLSTIWLTEM